MVNTLSTEVQSRIDAHLDSVERQLQATGAERSKRRGIVDDLETQILDMLAAKNLDAPTPAEVDEVLARLDPPEAYSGQTPSPVRAAQPALSVAGTRPVLCPQVGRAARWMIVGFLGLAGLWGEMAIANRALSAQAARRELLPRGVSLRNASTSTPLILLFVAGALVSSAAAITGPIVGTLLGWIATKRIRASDGSEDGLAYSLTAALLFPLLLIWLITSMNSEWGMLSLNNIDGHRVETDGWWAMKMQIWFFFASVSSIALVAILLKFSSSKPSNLRSLRLQSPIVATARG